MLDGPLFWAAGFFCNLDILYGGLGIDKLQFLIKKICYFFSAVIFFLFLVIKALDPDWSPASNAGSGSGSNEYRSETLIQTVQPTLPLQVGYVLLLVNIKIHETMGWDTCWNIYQGHVTNNLSRLGFRIRIGSGFNRASVGYEKSETMGHVLNKMQLCIQRGKKEPEEKLCTKPGLDLDQDPDSQKKNLVRNRGITEQCWENYITVKGGFDI